MYGALNAALVSGEIKFLRREAAQAHAHNYASLVCISSCVSYFFIWSVDSTGSVFQNNAVFQDGITLCMFVLVLSDDLCADASSAPPNIIYQCSR